MITEALEGEEKYFAARVSEAFKAAQAGKGEKYIGFLDGRRQEIVKEIARRGMYENYLLYGGYADSERKFLGVFPEYEEADEKSFPIIAVTVRYRDEDELSHRDFLGAVLAMGFERECVGDILVGKGHSVIFLSPVAAKTVLGDLCKVGRVGVKTEEGVTCGLPDEKRCTVISDTVASLRLDAIIASAVNVSREKAAALIRNGSVSVNYEVTDSQSRLLKEGDIISVRGSGRYVFGGSSGETKKGRLKINLRKSI